ncbi:glycosyl hydrolase [uncultured Bacteroides sp.]|jgi:mannan endo-1,4-beta-mannosidase|nr:glycosyl hydrolase [uncultured Bacteroides sp.]
MKMNKICAALFAAATFGLVACTDTDAKYTIPEVEAPVLVSTTPEANAAKVKRGEITIEVKYDKNVFFATKDLDKISFTGGTLISADVYGSSNVLTLTVNVPGRETACTLSIPEGVVLGPNKVPAPAVSLQFTTVALDKTPVMATSAKAMKLYDYLLANYETKSLSGMMAKESWNTDMSERVYQWTGKYPAINTFDYGHLAWSVAGANWINYGDITPVKEWADKNGIVSCMWHWNVPKEAPADYITLWSGERDMPADWSQSVQLNNDAAKAIFATAKVGDVVRVAVKDVEEGAQAAFKHGSTWAGITPEYEYFDITGDFTMPITEDILTVLKENGLIVGGHHYVATGIYLEGEGITGVPDLGTGYAFYKDETNFDASNALIEGTWENKFFVQDLASVAGYLKLLKEADIPVLWRPLHEAAGKWFWWGKDATSFKAIWIAMFDYFKAQGLDNLIWVWTAETGDEDWYPGDQYVDIIGSDIYSKDVETCASRYVAISATYGNKMITLSECGSVGKISEQWAAGARWSWFMPWYDGEEEDGTPIVHADEAWWKDAMEQSYVITRDQVPSME